MVRYPEREWSFHVLAGLYDQEVSLCLPLFQFSSKPFHLKSNVPFLVHVPCFVLSWMFLKHVNDLLFQITKDLKIFEPSAATKEAL